MLTIITLYCTLCNSDLLCNDYCFLLNNLVLVKEMINGTGKYTDYMFYP